MHVESHETQPSHTAVRVMVVAVLAAFMCFWHLPDLERVFGQPLGDWGFRTDGKVVLAVQPRGSADRAHIRAGESIDLLSNGRQVQTTATADFAANPGEKLIVNLHRGAKTETVVLRADAEAASKIPLVALRELLFVVPLFIGIALVLLRPGLVTWGLFLYILGSASAPTAVAQFRVLSYGGMQVFSGVADFIYAVLGSVGLVLFAFALSHRRLEGWRRAAVVVAGLFGLLDFGLLVHYEDLIPAQWLTVSSGCEVAVSLLALVGLLDAYLQVGTRFKQRLQWIGVGLLLATTTSIIDSLLFPHFESYFVHTAFSVAKACFPFIAAYAILRERVVDINFAISRTVVYGILTAAIVAIFALIDFFLSKVFERAQLSLPVDIVAALALGFSFHSVHGKVDLAVDRFLFRQRYRTELRLRKAANAVLHVNVAETVARFLVGLPTEILELTGAALYKKTDRDFALVERAGWDEGLPERIGAEDPLVVYASADLEPMRISDVPLRGQTFGAAAVPVLAVPLVLRRELVGFVLYGAHLAGADLDADEVSALVPLVANAMVTYDHLEAVALREEVSRLRTPVVASGVVA